MPLRKRQAAIAAIMSVTLLHAPVAGAATGASAPAGRDWSADTAAGPLAAAIERHGRGGEAMVLTLRPGPGVRVAPPVLRVDVPALVRGRFEGRFPAAVRPARDDARDNARDSGPLRVVLPLAAPVRFADPDRNDGMVRVEFRHCRGDDPRACAVERVDIPVSAGR